MPPSTYHNEISDLLEGGNEVLFDPFLSLLPQGGSVRCEGRSELQGIHERAALREVAIVTSSSS